MAFTSNTKRNGSNGLYQEYTVEAIDGLIKALYVIANKLDGDGGVTATDFTADMENVLSSGAAPIHSSLTAVSTAVQAAIA